MNTSGYSGVIASKRHGLAGRKQIVIPENLINDMILGNPVLNNLYITLIAYLPKAALQCEGKSDRSGDIILLYCLSGKGWYESRNGYREIKTNEFVIIPSTDGARNDFTECIGRLNRVWYPAIDADTGKSGSRIFIW